MGMGMWLIPLGQLVLSGLQMFFGPKLTAGAMHELSQQTIRDFGPNVKTIEGVMPSLFGTRYRRDDKGNVIGTMPSLVPSIFSPNFVSYMENPDRYTKWAMDLGKQGYEYAPTLIPKLSSPEKEAIQSTNTRRHLLW